MQNHLLSELGILLLLAELFFILLLSAIMHELSSFEAEKEYVSGLGYRTSIHEIYFE
jgi:uncharacterized membrane protein